MLTGDSIDVHEAHALGMVSKVFPNETLSEQTLEFAQRIAAVPTMAALLVKEAVNQTMDAQGFNTALSACVSPFTSSTTPTGPPSPTASGGSQPRSMVCPTGKTLPKSNRRPRPHPAAADRAIRR